MVLDGLKQKHVYRIMISIGGRTRNLQQTTMYAHAVKAAALSFPQIELDWNRQVTSIPEANENIFEIITWYEQPFDGNTPQLYSDEFGTVMTKDWIIDNYMGSCNSMYNKPFTITDGTHYMELTKLENNFNKPVYLNKLEELDYATPCWMTNGGNLPFDSPAWNTPLEYRCTYITVFHDAVTIDVSTKLSLNIYNGSTVGWSHSAINNWPSTGAWLIECAETSGSHTAFSVSVTGQSSGAWCNYLVLYGNPLNAVSWGAYSGTTTTVPIRPKHEIAVHYGGNSTLPYVASTPVVTYYFQDSIVTRGHNHWHDGTTNFPWESLHKVGVITGDVNTLVTKAPLYASSTPSATGGTCDRTIEVSGWYQHSSTNPSTDPWFWWDKSRKTWTYTYP